MIPVPKKNDSEVDTLGYFPFLIPTSMKTVPINRLVLLGKRGKVLASWCTLEESLALLFTSGMLMIYKTFPLARSHSR